VLMKSRREGSGTVSLSMSITGAPWIDYPTGQLARLVQGGAISQPLDETVVAMEAVEQPPSPPPPQQRPVPVPAVPSVRASPWSRASDLF